MQFDLLPKGTKAAAWNAGYMIFCGSIPKFGRMISGRLPCSCVSTVLPAAVRQIEAVGQIQCCHATGALSPEERAASFCSFGHRSLHTSCAWVSGEAQTLQMFI